MAIRLNINKQIEFNEFLHTYSRVSDGMILPGVTTLLHKHGLAPDFKGIPQEKLDAAADRGTAIHKLLEDYDNGKPVVDDEMGNLAAYKKLGLDVAKSEYLVSDNEVCASFIDKVFSDCSLGDIKSWATVDRQRKKYVTWQLSIYAYFFELQNPNKKVPHIYLIRVRDGKAEMEELNRIDNGRIEALLYAEKEGILFIDEDSTPLITNAISAEEASILLENISKIEALKESLKIVEQVVSDINEKVLSYMNENHLDEMNGVFGRFIKKASYTRSSVDSTRLKKDLPDVYQQYLKTTTVKESLSYQKNINN